jgi:hypothetical protein
MSRVRVKLAIGVAVLGVVATTTVALAGDEAKTRFRATLSGYEEVPTLSTPGVGTFRAAVSRSSDEIRYELSYEALESAVLQSHIHLGAPAVNGGITAFLCTNLGNGPAGTPTCPQPQPGETVTVSGTITPDEITAGALAQGIAAGEFDELVRAMRAGATYANVHSQTRTGGEIRGQIGDDEGEDGG